MIIVSGSATSGIVLGPYRFSSDSSAPGRLWPLRSSNYFDLPDASRSRPNSSLWCSRSRSRSSRNVFRAALSGSSAQRRLDNSRSISSSRPRMLLSPRKEPSRRSKAYVIASRLAPSGNREYASRIASTMSDRLACAIPVIRSTYALGSTSVEPKNVRTRWASSGSGETRSESARYLAA